MKRFVIPALVLFTLAAPAWAKDPVPAPKDKKPVPKAPAAPSDKAKADKAKAEKAKAAEKLDKITTHHAFAFKGDDSGNYAVQLKPGQPFDIVLDDNGASTGGLWVLTDADSGEQLAIKNRKGWTCADAASGVLAMQGQPVFAEPAKPQAPAAGEPAKPKGKGKAPAPAAPVVGQTGTLKWSFAAKKEGRQTLRFVFRRAWEKPSDDELAVVYAVTVAKDAKPGVTVAPKQKPAP